MHKRRKIASFESSAAAHLHQDALHLYNQLWGIAKFARHNPAPNPVTLRRNDLTRLHDFVVGEKNDGERCLLLFGATQDSDEEYVVAVNRKKLMMTVAVKVADPKLDCLEHKIDLYDGTLLDGEWVPSKQTFVVFDCVVAGGYSLRKRPLDDRLRAAAQVCACLAPNGFQIEVKTFVPVSQLKTLYRDIESGGKGACDGLIFVDKSAGIGTGRSPQLKKWKPLRKQTLDAVFHEGKWCCVGEHGRRVAVSFPVEGTGLEGTIYELLPPQNARAAKWMVLKARPDKLQPNHSTTVKNTLETIEENVTINEMLKSCSNEK